MAGFVWGEAAMRRLALFLVLSVVAAAPALAVPQPEAELAYARGDYATAFRLWLPLAEAGSAWAQENVARMYERGEWVAQDSGWEAGYQAAFALAGASVIGCVAAGLPFLLRLVRAGRTT